MAFKRMTGVKSPIQPQRPQQPSPDSGMMFAEVSMLLSKLQKMETDLMDAKAEVQKVVSHSLMIQQGPRGIQGVQGIRGEKGESIQGPQGGTGEQGSPGRDGVTPNIETIASSVIGRIKTPRDGRDAVIDEDAFIEKVSATIKNKKKLRPEDLEGWEQTIAPIRSLAAGFRGGGDTVSAGSGISISTVNGVKTITATGSGVTYETPTGTVNGSNTSFTVTATPLFVIVDGVTYFENNGYTLVGLAITTSVPPTGFIRSAF